MGAASLFLNHAPMPPGPITTTQQYFQTGPFDSHNGPPLYLVTVRQ